MNIEIDAMKMIKENAGKIRVGLATIGALSGGSVVLPSLHEAMQNLSKSSIVRMFEPQTASAAGELFKPPVYQGRDGRNVTIAAFPDPGNAYIFTSQGGLEIFNGADGLDAEAGVTYGGPTRMIVVANSTDMNLGVRAASCEEGLYIDVISDVGGYGYMERAPNAMDILEKDMSRTLPSERRYWSSIGLILVKDTNRNVVPDLIGGSIDRGLRPMSKGCGTVPDVIVPVLPKTAECANLEIPLGTNSGNGATVNEATVTRDVIAHGDLIINDEFRADDNGATGLIERVHATPANPAHIKVANPAWGGDIAAFCDPADMEANVAQGVDNIRSQGKWADVINWPGPKQQ